MGYRQSKEFFVIATVVVACFLVCRPINTSPVPSPARRAFDTSPAGVNNVNPNGVAQVQRLENVDATIKEVESLLNSDPSLPRLTRGEILDIIENLTRSDVQKSIARDPKAIMVVLPYSAESAQNGDVQSLYTKPPMTHLVNDGSEDVQNISKSEVPQKKRRPIKKPHQSNYENNQGVKIAKVPTTEASVSKFSKIMEEEHFQQQQSAVTQRPRTSTENPFTRFINGRRKTTKFPSNHKEEFQDLTTSTTTTTTTTTPEAPQITRRRKTTRKPLITTSTTTTTLRPFEIIPNQGIHIINPPSFQPTSAKPAVVAFQLTTTSTTPRYVPPSIPVTPTLVAPGPMMVDEIQIPDDFKDVLKSLDILIKQSPTQTSSIEDTLSESPLPNQLSEQDKLKLLFASLGVQTSTTTTTIEPDVMQVANNLTPEMKDLLMTFGLIPDPNKDKTTTPKVDVYMEPTSVINPDSYSGFKPLPAGPNSNPNEDMEDFLAKFGLVDKSKPLGGNREQKAISISKPQNELKPNIQLDVVPVGFKDMIADIIPPKVESNTPPSDSQNQSEKPTEDGTDHDESTKKPEHVFNPESTGTDYPTEDEINRLNKLMDFIKQFEKLNGTASEEDLKHIDVEGLKDLVNSFNVPLDEQNGPNPLDYDAGLLKNEVKRQTSTEKPEPINPSLALLEDSFGGSSDTVSETAQVQATITEAPKKTGFYYLLDWNSFFDIDNQKGKRVNLRFQPKVGDPNRFFSVNVP